MKRLLLLGYPILLFVGQINFINTGQAQDAHYWTEQYGTRSILLGGNVIGSVEDLGAVYYNPARLGLVEDPSFLLAAQVYELRSITVEDAVGENINLKDSKFGGIPSLVAGTFSIKKFGDKHRFAYAFVNRFRQDFDFFVRTETVGDIIEEQPGNEEFDGKIGSKKKLNEEWVGLTWSYPLSDDFSIGLTAFGVSRNQNAEFSMRLSALSEENGNVAVLIRNRTYSYQTYGILTKIGFAYATKPVTIGLTITTPKLALYGDGSLLYDDLLTGLSPENGHSTDVLALSVQDNLAARHHLPWAIGLGVGINAGKSKIHLSSEWFSKVKQYTVMEAEDFVAQSADTVIQNKLIDELKSILNFGAGYELSLSDKFSAYASAATNFSPVVASNERFTVFNPYSYNSTYHSDFFHLGGGICLNLPRWELTLGATYGGSSETIRRPVDLPTGDEVGDGIFEQDETGKIKTNRWRFIFAFSFSFGENEKVNIK